MTVRFWSWSPARRRLVGGLVGSVLVLLGGLISNDLPPGPLLTMAEPLQILGAALPGRALGLLTVIAGMALLARYWVSLVLMSRKAPEGARLREVRRTVAAWCVPFLIAPPLFSLDGWSYVAQGAMTKAGYDPYTEGPATYQSILTLMVAPLWRFTPTPYGPVPITWGALCAEVSHDPTVLLFLERVPVLVGMVLTAWAVPRLARALGVDAAVASAIALGSPFLLGHAVGGLHNDALIMGLVTAALVVASRRGFWPFAMVLVGIAAGIKVTAGVAAVPVLLLSLPAGVVWWRRVIRLALGGLISAVVLLACGLPYGLGLGWLKALSVPGVLVTPASLPTAVGLVAERILRADGSEAATMALPLARSIGLTLAVAIVVVMALVRPTGDLKAAIRTMIGVMAAVIVLSPVVHTWYPLVIVPMVALVATRGRKRQFVLVIGGVLGLSAPLDSSLAGAPLLVAGVVAGAMLLAGLHVVHVREHPQDAAKE